MRSLENQFNTSEYLVKNNMRVLEVKEDHVCMELRVTNAIRNIYGNVHGGSLFALADTTAGIQCMANGRKCVTLDGDIHFVHPATGSVIYSRSELVSMGHSVGVFHVNIFDEDKTLTSRATMTMYFIKEKREEDATAK